MSTASRWMGKFVRADRKTAARRVRSTAISASVEPLEGRALLSGMSMTAEHVHAAAVMSQQHESHSTGVVFKVPHFYEHYTGPKLAQLNAVAAAGELLPNGDFAFVGVNQGRINPNVTASYVFGIDRNGNLGAGPFPDRPNIKFDALVIVSIKPGTAPTASVVDLANHTTTPLSPSAVKVVGNAVAVTVPGMDLPSTGLVPSQYRFNYWPEDGGPVPDSIASFAPEFTDAQVGVIG